MNRTILYCICVLCFLLGCSPGNSETTVLWVSGFIAPCSPDSDSADCWLILKADDSTAGKWDVLKTDIQGFEFEAGYLKKIEVVAEEPAEAQGDTPSTTTYRLLKELERKPDDRLRVQGDWQLETVEGQGLEPDSGAPTLSLNLPEMKLHGNAGCNTYNGNIENSGMHGITFIGLINTLSICENQAIEDSYLKALGEIAFFKVKHSRLYLSDKNGQTQLVFTKMKNTKNSIRLHDIWMAVRVGGHPINRMVTIPRLEINTAEMKFFGNDGCNDYFGGIRELTESRISLGNIGTTRKMCPDMEMPQRYQNALTKSKTYHFEERFLVFNDGEDKEVLAFIKTD